MSKRLLNVRIFEFFGRNSSNSGIIIQVNVVIGTVNGQVINENPKEKNITHAVLGLTGIFRIWSCYDALVDRTGGVWHNRI